MSEIKIRKVSSRKDLRTFIDFHHDLYEGNAYDAPTLYIDDMNTLRKDKNAAFEFCRAEYYIAFKDGKVAKTLTGARPKAAIMAAIKDEL